MARNAALGRAKRARDDEWYTTDEVVAAEMDAWLARDPDALSGREICCPCDGEDSAFVRWLDAHMDECGIARVVAVRRVEGGGGNVFELRPGSEPRRFSIPDGDMLGDDVMGIMGECGLVITNPGFSCVTRLAQRLLESGLEFRMVAPLTTISGARIAPYLRLGRVRCGFTHGKMEFVRPDGSTASLGNACWIATGPGAQGRVHAMPARDALDDPTMRRTFARNGWSAFARYCNFDAIDVPALSAVPSDVSCVMGLPASYLLEPDPRLEIVGGCDGAAEAGRLGFGPLGQAWIDAYLAHGGTGHMSAGMRTKLGTLVDGRADTAFRRVLVRWREPQKPALSLDEMLKEGLACGEATSRGLRFSQQDVY